MKATATKQAREVRVGDLVFHQDYPAEVLHSQPCDNGRHQLIVWGLESADMCVVGAGELIVIGSVT